MTITSLPATLNVIDYTSLNQRREGNALWMILHSNPQSIKAVTVTQILTELNDDSDEQKTIQVKDIDLPFTSFDKDTKELTCEYNGRYYYHIPYGAAIAFIEW